MADDKVVKTGELVKQEPMALDTRPDFIATGDRSGTEHLTSEDIQMPRMGLAQQMSPEMVDGDPKFIDGLKIGNMFNSLTQTVYGNGPMDFCVVQALPPRWVEFIPREQGGGVADPNVPPGDPRTEFRTDAQGKRVPPIATKFYDFIIMLLPSRELIALSLKSTGLKVARQLNGLIAARNAPIFAGKYALSTTMTQNPKGRFAIFQVKNAGWLPDKTIYEYAETLFKSFAGKRDKIRIHTEDDGGDNTFDVADLERQSQEANGVHGM